MLLYQENRIAVAINLVGWIMGALACSTDQRVSTGAVYVAADVAGNYRLSVAVVEKECRGPGFLDKWAA